MKLEQRGLLRRSASVSVNRAVFNLHRAADVMSRPEHGSVTFAVHQVRFDNAPEIELRGIRSALPILTAGMKVSVRDSETRHSQASASRPVVWMECQIVRIEGQIVVVKSLTPPYIPRSRYSETSAGLRV